MPSHVVALPQRAGASAGAAGMTDEGQHAPEPVLPEVARRAVVAPLSPRRYEIRVTVGEETHAALVQLQDLLSCQVRDRDPAVIISRALDLLLERTLARKAAVIRRPRAGEAPERRTRHIPAAVQRAVWQRDQGQCAYVDGKGRRAGGPGRGAGDMRRGARAASRGRL